MSNQLIQITIIVCKHLVDPNSLKEEDEYNLVAKIIISYSKFQ